MSEMVNITDIQNLLEKKIAQLTQNKTLTINQARLIELYRLSTYDLERISKRLETIKKLEAIEKNAAC